jgi:hypothetical protein
VEGILIQHKREWELFSTLGPHISGLKFIECMLSITIISFALMAMEVKATNSKLPTKQYA